MTDWKDKPHWVLRFDKHGNWEVTDPSGKVMDASGEFRTLDLSLGSNQLPTFNSRGTLVE